MNPYRSARYRTAYELELAELEALERRTGLIGMVGDYAAMQRELVDELLELQRRMTPEEIQRACEFVRRHNYESRFL